MHLVPCEARKLVADLDDAVLVGLEEKADIAVIYYRNPFVLRRFIWRELDVGIDPSLDRSERFV